MERLEKVDPEQLDPKTAQKYGAEYVGDAHL